MADYNSKKYREMHDESMREFTIAESAQRDERKQAVEDRRFYSISGAMWEGKLGEQFENKPKFEVNKIHLAVIRIINEYRNNRVTADFYSKDGSDKEQLADTCDGLFRADIEDSDGDEALDNGFEEAIGGGMGAFRLQTEYEDEYDEENEKQRIRFKPIYDADTNVYFDANAKRQDKSDAKRCWVLTAYTHDAYKEEFGDDPASWPKDITDGWYFDWYTPETVYVSETYIKEEVYDTWVYFKSLTGEEERVHIDDLDQDEEDILRAQGFKEERRRKIKTCKIRKIIESGMGVLEDCGYIAGKHIPVVPIYGKRWFVDNIERFMGHVRLAKDPSRLANMQKSKLAEISALSTVEKPIVTPEQIAGHELMWSDDNIKNYPYLLLNPITNEEGQEVASPPVGYTKVPNIPPALAALLQLTDTDLRDILGNQEGGEEIESNISGKAVELIQNRLDMQSYIYISNFGKAIKRAAKIWLDMAREVYVEEGRKMKSVMRDGLQEYVELMRPVMQKGQMVLQNDLSDANFDIGITIGPTSTSKKSATIRTLSQMRAIETDPKDQAVLSAMIMMNMEGEGVSEVRDYYRQKLLRLGAAKPTEEEAKQLEAEAQNQKPSAEDQYLMAEAAKAQTDAQKNQVETIKEQAQADKIRAETQEILSKLDIEKLKAMVEVVEKLGPRVEPTQQIQGTNLDQGGFNG